MNYSKNIEGNCKLQMNRALICNLQFQRRNTMRNAPWRQKKNVDLEFLCLGYVEKKPQHIKKNETHHRRIKPT